MNFEIELQVIGRGFDRESCWVHPRAGAIPKPEGLPIVVLAMYKLRLTGMDVFYPINDMRTDDGGQTWFAIGSIRSSSEAPARITPDC